MAATLLDAGPMIAYYDAGDAWHSRVSSFFERFAGQFVSTVPCLTEALYMLRTDYRVQNELLLDVSRGLIQIESLLPEDYSRIAELNTKYRDMPGDFADLSLIVLSERLDLKEIVSLDSDFEVYKRYGKSRFKRLFPT